MDANARTGRRGGGKLGSEECKVFGAYGRDTLNDNGERLLSFSAILNTLFSSTKNAISHTFNGRGKKRSDYILTRQRGGKLVRYYTPPTVILTHLGSQYRHNTCENVWSLRSQQTGEGVKGTDAYRQTTTDE